jgi:uncharacterized protein YqgV (UPF0045/DUF77 family)
MVVLVDLEFIVEPFVEGNPGRHVHAAVDAVEAHELRVDLGPFSSSTQGTTEAVAAAVRDLLVAGFNAGADRIQLHVRVVDSADHD